MNNKSRTTLHEEALKLFEEAGLGRPALVVWQLNWRERLEILFVGKIYWTQLTFNNRLQPVRASLTFDQEKP